MESVKKKIIVRVKFCWDGKPCNQMDKRFYILYASPVYYDPERVGIPLKYSETRIFYNCIQVPPSHNRLLLKEISGSLIITSCWSQ